MNGRQKKRLDALIEKFESIKATIAETLEPLTNDLGELKSELTTLRNELQESFDSKSERWQESERGELAETQIVSLNEADDKLETAIESMNGIADEIESAITEMQDATGES